MNQTKGLNFKDPNIMEIWKIITLHLKIQAAHFLFLQNSIF